MPCTQLSTPSRMASRTSRQRAVGAAIRITDEIAIHETEIDERFAAPGSCGQNVNKVSTSVELASTLPDRPCPALQERWHPGFPPDTGDGVLVIDSREHRTQSANRDAAASGCATLTQARCVRRGGVSQADPVRSRTERRIAQKVSAARPSGARRDQEIATGATVERVAPQCPASPHVSGSILGGRYGLRNGRSRYCGFPRGAAGEQFLYLMTRALIHSEALHHAIRPPVKRRHPAVGERPSTITHLVVCPCSTDELDLRSYWSHQNTARREVVPAAER